MGQEERAVDRQVPSRLAEARRRLMLGEWDEALRLARAAAEIATEVNDPRLMISVAAHLEKLCDFNAAARLLAAGGRALRGSTLPEWTGGRHPDKTLLVVQRIRHIAAPIRTARLIPLAAGRFRRCIVLAERRLVGLFQRSFPSASVRAAGEADAETVAEADMVASYETLMEYLAPDAAAMLASFRPLQPDPQQVCTLKTRLSSPSARYPQIGITWASTNTRKDVPTLHDWAGFMRRTEAEFVSLQYGDVAADLEVLTSLSGKTIRREPSVDPFEDLDGLAAEIAALDAIVAVSNTTAHLAGAVGTPAVVLLDDSFMLTWPARGETTPWYPAMRLARKKGRAWSEVFVEVGARLSRLPIGPGRLGPPSDLAPPQMGDRASRVASMHGPDEKERE